MPNSLYNDDELAQPNENEFLATGVIGMLVFSVVFSLAVYSFFYKTKSNESKLFYISMTVMAVFEFPRYVELCYEKDYSSTMGYAMHIIASFFYFICLVVVAFLFAHILSLGSKFAMIYSRRGLIFAVCCKGVVDIIALVFCCQAENLGFFFSSYIFRFYTIFDIFQNLLYSTILTFFGLRLIFRFHNIGENSIDSAQRVVFQRVVHKVTLIQSAVSCFALMRLSLLIVKFAAIQHTAKSVTTSNFALYGLIWFFLADFFPRGVASVILSVMMQCERPNLNSTSGGDASNPIIKIKKNISIELGKEPYENSEVIYIYIFFPNAS